MVTGSSRQIFNSALTFAAAVLRFLDTILSNKPGTAVAQWLRCCATNLKVAGSIPADVSGIFH